MRDLNEEQAKELLKELVKKDSISLEEIEAITSRVSMIDKTAGEDAVTYLYSGKLENSPYYSSLLIAHCRLINLLTACL